MAKRLNSRGQRMEMEVKTDLEDRDLHSEPCTFIEVWDDDALAEDGIPEEVQRLRSRDVLGRWIALIKIDLPSKGIKNARHYLYLDPTAEECESLYGNRVNLANTAGMVYYVGNGIPFGTVIPIGNSKNKTKGAASRGAVLNPFALLGG